MILLLLLAAAPAEEAAAEAAVTDDRAFVFEQPSVTANVVRMLYFGEVLRVDTELVAEDGRRWTRVRLGPEMAGYVESSRLMPTVSLPQAPWRPTRVVRSERPLGVSVRAGMELFGSGINVRYLPYSRIGVSFTGGSVVDGERARGTAFSSGLVSFLVLWNLSPMLEAGYSRVSYHKGNAVLRGSLFYATAGAEWIFDFGLFLNAGVTYYRSIDVEIAHNFRDVDGEQLDLPASFGSLQPQDGALQGLIGGFGFGYAF